MFNRHHGRLFAVSVVLAGAVACSDNTESDDSSAAEADVTSGDGFVDDGLGQADGAAVADAKVGASDGAVMTDTPGGSGDDGAAGDAPVFDAPGFDAPVGDAATGGDASSPTDTAAPDEPINVGAWKPEKDDGKWPVTPWKMPDGRVWLPTRTIDDGKGGTLVIRNPPPLRKPVRTWFSPGAQFEGAVQLKFVDGAGMSFSNGAWKSDGKLVVPGLGDPKALNGAFQSLAGLGKPARMFLGDHKKLAAERLDLERKLKRSVPDLGAFYVVPLKGDVAQVCDALNKIALVELAWPMSRASTDAVEAVNPGKQDDLWRRTPDFTPYQGYVLRTGANNWGGHDAILPWNFEGGRGETVPAAQIEAAWNLGHEDLQLNNGAVYSTYLGGKKTTLDRERYNHAQAVLGIVKSRNNGFGVTGLASNAVVGLMPSRPDDQAKWIGVDPALALLPNDTWGGMYAVKIQYLAGKLAEGGTIFFSLGLKSPNHRTCTTNDECTPRVACMPIPPYLKDTSGNVIRRCEGIEATGVANNACTSDADCATRWGIRARCLPVNAHAAGTWLKASYPQVWGQWRCAGDVNGKHCTTSLDCDPVGQCVADQVGTQRCGGAKAPADLLANATVGPATTAAGTACANHAACANLGDSNCAGNFCTWNNENWRRRRLIPFEYDPGIYAAIRFAAARGITVLQAAGNEHQRLGFFSEDAYPLGGQTSIFNGHDTFLRFYDCALPGCRPPSGGFVIGATDGGIANKAGFTSRGPRVDFNSWGQRVATIAYGSAFDDSFIIAGVSVARHDYTLTFNGTSSATPIMAGLVLQLQGLVKAHTGKLMRPEKLRVALHAGGTLINNHAKTDHGHIGVRPNLASSMSWLENEGMLPAGMSSIGAESLTVKELSAVRMTMPGGAKELVVTMTIRNGGERISPAIGLIVRTGPKGGGKAGATDDRLGSCLDNAKGEGCCSSGGPPAPGCTVRDLADKQVFVPMIPGTKTAKGGGEVKLSFRASLAGGGAAGDVCVELDVEKRLNAPQRLASKPAIKCATVGVLPGVVGITAGYQARGLDFKAGDPVHPVCGKDWGFAGSTVASDVVVTSRNQQLALMAFPHSGTIGVSNIAADCAETDFNSADAAGTCGTKGVINRLPLAPTPTGIGGCAQPSLDAALGFNPQGLALTRDQRFAVVVMNHLKDPCKAGKLALVDLRTPGDPRLFTKKVGGKDVPVYVTTGPNPVSVAVTHEGTKDARIVVAARSDWVKCKNTPRLDVMKLADVLKDGASAKVDKRWLPVGRDFRRVVIDKQNKAAWVAMDYKHAAIGMLRFKDMTAHSIHKKKGSVLGWNRIRAIAPINHADGKVRVLLVERDFGSKQDSLGGKCPSGFVTCAGFHYVTVDVDSIGTPSYDVFWPGTGLLLPISSPTDIVVSADRKRALVSASAWWVQNMFLGGPKNTVFGFANFAHGKAHKVGGLWRMVNVPEPEPEFCPDEVCNTIDDDCDGETNEDWPELGKPCSLSTGICYATGTFVCGTKDKLTTTCNAKPAPKQVELCNGLDDDCDGTVDNPWHEELGESCYAGKGACYVSGKRVCKADGSGPTCNAVAGKPSKEVCGNGLDEDCDGINDNGCKKPGKP